MKIGNLNFSEITETSQSSCYSNVGEVWDLERSQNIWWFI